MLTEQTKEVSFQSMDLNINGKLISPPESKDKHYPGILFIHGWKSDQEGYVERAKILSKLGYICLTFNLPGHGKDEQSSRYRGKKSDGDIQNLTRQDYLNAVIAAYDYLVKIPEIDKAKISVVGASFGGYLAAILTQLRAVDSLILRAPSNYKDEGFDSLPQFKYNETYAYPNETVEFDQTMAAQALHKFRGKMLIIESEKDATIPHQVILNYINSMPDIAQTQHVVIEGAAHTLEEKDQQKFLETLKEWFGSRF